MRAPRHRPSARGDRSIEALECRRLFHAGHVHDLVAPAVEGAPAPGATFRLAINAGGRAFTDAAGNVWERDRHVRGGKAARRVYDVGGTGDEGLFAQHRTGKLIRYALPVPAPGQYTLTLLFADPKFTAGGLRRFNAFAEDQPILSGFDVAASGGGRSAIVQRFPVTVSDGVLDVVFQALTNKAIVSGLEVTQGEVPAAPASAWQEAAPAPVALFESQGAAVGAKLYLFGGFHNGDVQATRAAYAYDPATNAWTPRAEMPAAVTHAGVAVEGTVVWVVGGLLGDYSGGANPTTADVWKYDTVADAWSAGPALPSAVGAGGVAVVGRNLHAFGGLGADGQRDTGAHYVLNLDDPQAAWAPAASLPVARNHFGTAVLDGRIYAIGGQHGRDETRSNLRDVHVYTPQSNRWAPVARLPKPMSHFHPSTAAVNGRILIAGGVTNGRAPLSDVWEYDPAANRWAASAPLPAPRKAPVMGVLGTTVYVLTGSPGDNFPQATMWYRTL